MLNSQGIDNYHARQNPVRLDETDLAILRELTRDARLPNNVLASRAGVAPSTCLGRVRALQEAGIIRGYHADVDPRALGLQIRAVISVVLRPEMRDRMLPAARRLRDLPEVTDVFVLGGTSDLHVHVMCATVESLRDFIAAHLGANPVFATTQTSLVFEQLEPGGDGA
ncbi:Lrp/AsnC family transcriptional regulator [Zhihengliuella salsuginis]|uniref:Transcriptional regulator, AsnC family protein n=1 Tax=Zhihengliuella salsuginis TaxID=578222 RepID=A0ABQ3GC39_9MICC|nr:Lrp/AsnC family transcriptional regulator [Zhihengliuella salsuginis]GHC99299.1 putative transcriptional regulator, AsnC family protein [Zhihengliuella salsuginis]